MTLIRLTLALLLFIPGAAMAAGLGSARISLLSGDVQIHTSDTQDWVPAAINLPLQEGDRLWVPEGSRTEVHLQREGYIRLDAGTAFDLVTLRSGDLQFYLDVGHAYFNNRPGSTGEIRIDTPLVSIDCADDTRLMIDVEENGATAIAVLDGEAAVATTYGTTRIESGAVLTIGRDLTFELAPLMRPGEWEKWNRARDRRLTAQAESRRYLPAELDDYGDEFDSYGTWVSVAGIGYCWRPVAISVDWSPYRYGRWTWIGGDYVWISYEPWGWVPHHYGRWTFVASFGWCWVPPVYGAVYWGPGFVSWVSTPTYVAWVPLAPGEIYYGRRHYGPGHLTLADLAQSRSRSLTLRNLQASNAVTVVSRDSFISGRGDAVRLRRNPFAEAYATPGPPALKPTRQLSRPIHKAIPESRRPPERIRQLIPEAGKQRPLQRDLQRPAQRPGRTAPAPALDRSDRTQPRIQLQPQPSTPGLRQRLQRPADDERTQTQSPQPRQLRPLTPEGRTEPQSPRVAPPLRQERPEVAPEANPLRRLRPAPPAQDMVKPQRDTVRPTPGQGLQRQEEQRPLQPPAEERRQRYQPAEGNRQQYLPQPEQTLRKRLQEESERRR